MRALALLLSCLAVAGTAVLGRPGVPLAGAPDQAAADVLHAARQQVGDTYVWGATGPDAWDCSGLTQRIWSGVPGVRGMPRTSREQQRWALPVRRDQLLPGDLVFYGDPVTHVGIYAGGGRMVDGSASRGRVVERALWPTSDTVRYGRVPRPTMPAVAGAPAAAAASLAPGALPGLPAAQKQLSSQLAYKVAAEARALVGRPVGVRGGLDPVSLVHVAWRNAGGGGLPGSREGIAARGRSVPLADARKGDLVVYGRPAVPHLGVYVGGGLMVDASPKQGRVVLRPVYDASTVRLVRLG